MAHDDAGMTLVELLISIAILGLIIGPLVIAMYMGLSTAKAATGRTTDSTAAQLLSAYFPTDVESSDAVRTSGFTCGGAQTAVEFEWTDAGTGVKTDVEYTLIPSGGSDSEDQFRRQAYAVAGGTCTKTSDDVLVQAVDPASSTTVTCLPTASCASPLTQVTIDVTAFAKKPGGSALYSKYTFHLTSTRRVG